MKQRVPVSQIMSKELITLSQKDSLYDAENLFKKHNIRHLPVVENKKLVGVVSYSDLLKISYVDVTEDDDIESVVYDAYTVTQLMAKTPVSILPSSTVKEAAEILSKHSFHSIPVVENEELVGIVTTTDLLNYFIDQY
ncbi:MULTISPECIES: CBS domain-containing protein [Sphingobacterium]|uniref:CBS domain-containing protein n=1 Tax=Sphingobacterium hotanense TaxID=649196 RepID=A0ABT7NSW5_9SPHI|nr:MULTISPECIES: CBS domain-containing protein [Sphingobacterium]MCT1526779.1 CBS domain-containing protein [Sphingobacterium hotanense]MDM1050337.1 CBS domain-containing protein [Sphingobacterium hotanense]